ncbi:MAG TPA: hypothetical protein VGB77_18275 [Abditibacteriaceae bacterium]
MPKAGLPALWSLKILDLRTDPHNLKGVRTYDAPHGVPMHLFILSRDGSEYAHLYPDLRDYGNFLLRPVIPRAGAYQLWVDFMPIDGYPTMHSQKFLVAGNEMLKPQRWAPSKASDGRLEAKMQAREEQSFAARPDAPGYVVQLQNRDWQAKQSVNVKAWVLDDNKKPVTNLQLHLGGPAYGVALSEDGEQFLRLEAQPRQKSSHETEFSVTFPTSGLYKMWLEFRHENKIIVAPFIVQVKASKPNAKKGIGP